MEPSPSFVDTNLFLRFLTNDVPDQAEAARRLFERALREEASLTTSILVVAEVVWVLESYYEFPREQIKEAVSV